MFIGYNLIYSELELLCIYTLWYREDIACILGEHNTHQGSHLDNQIIAKCEKCKEGEACRDSSEERLLKLSFVSDDFLRNWYVIRELWIKYSSYE